MAELQHYARLGKTFSVGWLGGWLGGWVVGSEKLKIRLKLSTAGAWALLSLAIIDNSTDLHHSPFKERKTIFHVDRFLPGDLDNNVSKY